MVFALHCDLLDFCCFCFCWALLYVVFFIQFRFCREVCLWNSFADSKRILTAIKFNVQIIVSLVFVHSCSFPFLFSSVSIVFFVEWKNVNILNGRKMYHSLAKFTNASMMVIYGITCPKANLYSGPNKRKKRMRYFKVNWWWCYLSTRARFDLQKCHVTCVWRKKNTFFHSPAKRMQVRIEYANTRMKRKKKEKRNPWLK